MRALLGPLEGDLNTAQMTCRAVTVGAGGKKNKKKKQCSGARGDLLEPVGWMWLLRR